MPNPTVIGTVKTGITLMSSDLNSLANNALVLSSINGASGVFSNVAGDSYGTGYPLGTFVLHLAALAAAATANSGVDVWFLSADDGTNYEAGSSTITPARAPDFTFPLIAQSAAQVVKIANVVMPVVGKFQALVRSNGVGQSFASSGNTIIWYPATSIFPTQ